MTSNNNNWIADTVGDFVHSTIWAAPIHTFIEENCAAFDYDDVDDDDDGEDTSPSTGASEEEQKKIHHRYQLLANALINGLGNDLSLDPNELRKACEIPTEMNEPGFADEALEQLYAVQEFGLFQEMMRRKNLILQLQALVSLQLQWGLLTHGESGEDLVLSLLLQATAATSSSSRRGSVAPVQQSMEQPMARLQIDERENKRQENDEDDDDDDVVVVPVKETRVRSPAAPSHKPKARQEPKKPPKEEYQLPNLRRKGGADHDADWFRKLGQDHAQRESGDETIEEEQAKKASTAQAIRSIPDDVLRQKLRDLAAPVDENAAAAVKSRKNFLQEQRDLIVQKQRAERERELERETQEQQQQQPEAARPARPQSAAHIARKAMGTANEKEQPPTQIPDAELQRRRAMADRLRREVVDKR